MLRLVKNLQQKKGASTMPGHHLTPTERGKIEAYHEKGMTGAAIARKLGRAISTVSRELRRNSGRNGYDAEKAQQLYKERRKECRPREKLDYKPLREYVIEKIRDEEWTPEQVAGSLPLHHPDDPRMRISHETIYQAIYRKLGFLIIYLPQARPKRRKRGQGKTRRGPTIPNRVGIEQRPDHVEKRDEPGHWEGDTLVGKNQDGFVVTLVERSARLLHAIKVHSKHAEQVARAVIASLLDRPISWVRTITFDNGTEFAKHERIKEELGTDIYFADPYAAYQRGTNENTNGLIRRYLPKGMSFKDLTQRQLDAIVDRLNNRPRKCLGYRTPNEVFQQQRQQLLVALSS
jgi:IS30 family transposase